MDINIPMGSSLPEIIVLDNTSAHIKKIAPLSAVIETIFLWSVPNNILMIWGIIRPTKPIIPDEYTINPIIKEDISK